MWDLLCGRERGKQKPQTSTENLRLSGARGADASKPRSDGEKLDAAFAAKDAKGLIDLLRSDSPIDRMKERSHPWAAQPKTVGSLAAANLTILASSEQDEHSSDSPDDRSRRQDQLNSDNEEEKGPAQPAVPALSFKKQVAAAGGIPILVECLTSEQEDRRQIAVVALSFLLAECEDNAIAAHAAGALPLLLGLLDTPIVGLRVSATVCLRNIYTASEEFQSDFIKIGGMEKLVEYLVTEKDSTSLNYVDVQCETMLNLQDLLEDSRGDLIPEYIAKAQQLGAVEKLTPLTEATEADEVRAVATELVSRLNAGRRPEYSPPPP